MADIKTRDAVKGTIKTIDKSAVAAERMKDTFIRTKEKADHSYYSAENSPEEYAADRPAAQKPSPSGQRMSLTSTGERPFRTPRRIYPRLRTIWSSAKRRSRRRLQRKPPRKRRKPPEPPRSPARL